MGEGRPNFISVKYVIHIGVYWNDCTKFPTQYGGYREAVQIGHTFGPLCEKVV